MASVRWVYHGDIIVLVDGAEIHGRGRLGARPGDGGGWRVEVTHIWEQAGRITDLHRRQVHIWLPGGGRAVARQVVPVEVGNDPLALRWLIDGDDPPPALPPRGAVRRFLDWLTWQLDRVPVGSG